MKLSPAAELAVRGMLTLAEHYGQGPVTLHAICLRRNLPRQYLTKIFGRLARAGLVSPIRGKRGGYTLAADPRHINLLQVIEAVEGPVALALCQHTPTRCSSLDCVVRGVWTEIQKVVRTKLQKATLAKCIRKAHAKV